MRLSVPSSAVSLVTLFPQGCSVRRRRSCRCKTSRGRWAFPAAATLALASRTGNVSEHRGALAGRNRGPASLGPATSACLFEFGTGFLPSETGAPKGGPEDDVPAQRSEIGDHHSREMAAEMAFLLASYQ